MSLEKKTDKIIRDKLRQHASPLPAHLWEGVDAILESDKKRRRGGFWWWSGGAALLLVLVTAGYFMLMPSIADYATSNLANVTPVASNVPTTDNVQETYASETPSATENQNTKNITNTNTPSVADASNAVATQINTKADSPKNQAAAIKKNVVASKLVTTTESTANTTFVDEDESIVAENSSNTSLLIDASTSEESPLAKEVKALVGLQLTTEDEYLEDRSFEELDWDLFINKDPKCARFGKWLRLYFYADAYVSPDIAFRSLKPKHADYYDYSQTREDTESPRISYSTGLRFSVVSNYGWAARTGIVYSQINEKFDYESESEVRTTIKTIKGPNGEFIRNDTLVEYGSRFKTTYNHYKMIDIPLILGYEVNFKKKLSMSLNGGVYFNIMSRQKGDFLSPDNGGLVSFTSQEEGAYPAFKNRLNLSLYGSVGFIYNMTDHWQILLEPQVRYYMDPLTNRSYMVEQSYFSTGLIAGLRYKF